MIKPPSQTEKDNTKKKPVLHYKPVAFTETQDAKRLDFSLIQSNP
jgi:hypothetical protein